VAENLVKRGSVYYARAAVPKSLRELRRAARVERNPREVWISLGTRDPAEAKRRLAEQLARTLRAFEADEAALRSGGTRPLVKPDQHDLQRARWEFTRRELDLDELERVRRPSAAQLDAQQQQLLVDLQSYVPTPPLGWLAAPGVLELMRARDPSLDEERRAILAEELRQHLADSNYVLIDWAVQELAQRHGWDIPPESDTYKTLARELMKAWRSVLETAAKRDKGSYEEPATVATLAPPHPSAAESPPAGESISSKPRKGETLADYFDAYLKECKAHVSPNARIDLWATLRQFVECNGNRQVTSYGKADMANYKKGLREFPKNAAKLYPGMTFDQVVTRNRKDGHPLLSDRSVRNKLSALSAFGRWLEGNVDGVDPASFKTSLPKIQDAERMEPFSQDDVRKILNSYAFTGSESPRTYQRPGDHKLRDWHFWLPLIAAFTGARLNEIVQLEVADLVEVDGIWAFNISDEEEGQSLKTQHSRRVIPVHPQLLDLGLLVYREAVVAAGKTALFHPIQLDRHGRRSTAAGKWFRMFLRRIGVKGADDLGGTHRWRHTLTDSLRRAGIEDYQIASVLGHKIDVAKMTGHYGRDVTMSLAQRRDFLSRAAYPSVDFTLLR
jgi:integrase